ncbi:MAG: hypothetical protein ACNS62_22420 [Candidatus Cyclobacteriaceae bacterium M3_2C_046]
MKYCLSPILLVLLSLQLYAGDYQWFSGKIQLSNQEIISGELSIDYYRNLIMCKNEYKIKTFPAFQVDQFSFFDQKINQVRQFRSVTLSSYEEVFFEIVLAGEISLLRREKSMNFPTMDFYSFFTPTKHEPSRGYKSYFEYFFLVDHKIIKIKNFKRQIDRFTRNRKIEIDQFMNRENMDLKNYHEKIKLIKYYNLLEELEQQVLTLAADKLAV